MLLLLAAALFCQLIVYSSTKAAEIMLKDETVWFSRIRKADYFSALYRENVFKHYMLIRSILPLWLYGLLQRQIVR